MMLYYLIHHSEKVPCAQFRKKNGLGVCALLLSLRAIGEWAFLIDHSHRLHVRETYCNMRSMKNKDNLVLSTPYSAKFLTLEDTMPCFKFICPF